MVGNWRDIDICVICILCIDICVFSFQDTDMCAIITNRWNEATLKKKKKDSIADGVQAFMAISRKISRAGWSHDILDFFYLTQAKIGSDTEERKYH